MLNALLPGAMRAMLIVYATHNIVDLAHSAPIVGRSIRSVSILDAGRSATRLVQRRLVRKLISMRQIARSS
jgi:hypothetical protein